MNKFSKIIITAFLFTTITTVSFANMEKGQSAMHAKNYSLAHKELSATIQDATETKENKVRALSIIGSMHLNGLGRKKDNIKAFNYYEVAADARFVDAQFQLANMYFKGIGTKINYKKAVKYYFIASEQGHGPSATQMGRMYENGIGKKINLRVALTAYLMGFEGGDPQAEALIIKIKPKISQKDIAFAEKMTREWVERSLPKEKP